MINKCQFGCDQEATHQLKNGKWCCSEYHMQCPEFRKQSGERMKQYYMDHPEFKEQQVVWGLQTHGLQRVKDSKSEKMKLLHKDETFKKHYIKGIRTSPNRCEIKLIDLLNEILPNTFQFH